MIGLTINIEIVIAILLSLLLVNVFLIKWMFSQYKFEVDDHEARLRLIERGWITAEAWRSMLTKYARDVEDIKDEVRAFKSEILERLSDINRKKR